MDKSNKKYDEIHFKCPTFNCGATVMYDLLKEGDTATAAINSDFVPNKIAGMIEGHFTRCTKCNLAFRIHKESSLGWSSKLVLKDE